MGGAIGKRSDDESEQEGNPMNQRNSSSRPVSQMYNLVWRDNDRGCSSQRVGMSGRPASRPPDEALDTGSKQIQTRCIPRNRDSEEQSTKRPRRRIHTVMVM